jgi:hypothetical protein
MKTSAFVLLLSLLANLSFAGLSGDTIPVISNYDTLNSVCRDGGLKICLVGDWTNISQEQQTNSFASLTIYGSGKFEGTDAKGKRICGRYEVSNESLSLLLHKICEKTGADQGTLIGHIELLDGHMLSLEMPEEMGGKQLFIQ